MLRAAAFALTAALVLVTPTIAGPTENAFLSKLVGTWTGKGSVSGSETGPVACKIVIKQGSAGKVTYSGRCNMQDAGAQSFSGTLAYNDAKKVYEGKAMGTTSVGKKSGSSVVFTTNAKTIAGRVSSSMSVSAKSIVIDFSVTSSKGAKAQSRISFAKQG